jgi:glycosyltransferase involved in cell wall biosynthesis
MMMTRIAFPFGAGNSWMGGLSYYDNLLAILNRVRDPAKHVLIGLIPEDDMSFKNLTKYFDEVYLLSTTKLMDKVVNHVSGVLSAKNAPAWLSPETILSRSLRRIKADVAFLNPLDNFKGASICWFPDFQYLHMPEMFGLNEAQKYARVVHDSAALSSRIMLSSESVRKDFLSVLPEFIDKVRVVPFAALIDDSIYSDDSLKIAREYHLPERFFYLPNQFWKHKNHLVVLKALTLLKENYQHIVVVAGGPMDDYRNPSYPSELVAEISRRDLRSQFILLGMLPRRHVYALIRQSIALVQPSLFEGWSSSIEEAKSLGKAVIASNLDVHLEQNAPGALYFDPKDPQQLADCLIRFEKELQAGVDPIIQDKARISMRLRVELFGNSFLDLTSETAGL